MAAADKDAATAGAQSVRRALAVLRVLATGQERGVRLTDVAAHTGLNRPTVHRILRVLVEESAVEQDLATRRYLIGGEVSLLGLARSARFPIRAIAEPHLRHLSESLGGTTLLTIRNGVDSVCIDRRPGSFSVKVLSIEIGARRPLGVGVSGLVLLASLQPEEAAEGGGGICLRAGGRGARLARGGRAGAHGGRPHRRRAGQRDHHRATAGRARASGGRTDERASRADRRAGGRTRTPQERPSRKRAWGALRV